jgi:hypothetical protein
VKLRFSKSFGSEFASCATLTSDCANVAFWPNEAAWPSALTRITDILEVIDKFKMPCKGVDASNSGAAPRPSMFEELTTKEAAQLRGHFKENPPSAKLASPSTPEERLRRTVDGFKFEIRRGNPVYDFTPEGDDIPEVRQARAELEEEDAQTGQSGWILGHYYK